MPARGDNQELKDKDAAAARVRRANKKAEELEQKQKEAVVDSKRLKRNETKRVKYAAKVAAEEKQKAANAASALLSENEERLPRELLPISNEELLERFDRPEGTVEQRRLAAEAAEKENEMACRPTLITVQDKLATVIGMVGTLAEGPGSSEASRRLLASNSNINVVQDALIAVQNTLAAAIMVGTHAEGQAPIPVDTMQDSYDDGDLQYV
jgi:hypothetical protein